MRQFLLIVATVASPAGAQLADDMSRTIRPNALDRAGRQVDRRASVQAAGSANDRRDAQSSARAAARQVGPVGGSTMTDGPRGLGLGSTPRPDRPR